MNSDTNFLSDLIRSSSPTQTVYWIVPSLPLNVEGISYGNIKSKVYSCVPADQQIGYKRLALADYLCYCFDIHEKLNSHLISFVVP